MQTYDREKTGRFDAIDGRTLDSNKHHLERGLVGLIEKKESKIVR